jgi:hypothetical protein
MFTRYRRVILIGPESECSKSQRFRVARNFVARSRFRVFGQRKRAEQKEKKEKRQGVKLLPTTLTLISNVECRRRDHRCRLRVDA